VVVVAVVIVVCAVDNPSGVNADVVIFNNRRDILLLPH
jgi:hypothetical protein